MSQAAGGRDPVTITSHFTRPGKPGPVIIEVEEIRVGRAFSTNRANVLSSGGSILLTAVGTFFETGRLGEAQVVHGAAPELPSPDECVLAVPAKDAPLPPPFMAKIEERIHPDDAAALMGDRTGIARIRGWVRLKDEEPLDVFALLLAADALPPAVFNTNLPLAWTPTLEMTTHIRAADPTGWLRCQFRTRFVTGGYLEEDGEIWDDKGRLVAQSRQLALVPRG
jgi:acyl-CoA thioesterase